MRITGIICEFNPFHNGHKYLIDSVRRDLNPDAVVCVMSGNFVQRGAPALMDKYARAHSALASGADLVLELPALYAVAPAFEFANGAIRLLAGLGCVSELAFGSENGNSEHFEKTGAFLSREDEKFRKRLKNKLAEGVSYASAMAETISAFIPGLPGNFLEGPNNLLGMEYARANIKYKAGLKLCPYLRAGEGSSMGTEGSFASATTIRNLILENNDNTNYVDYIPNSSAEALIKTKIWDAEAEKRLFDILRYLLIVKSPKELESLFEVSEGLENRLKKAVLEAQNTDDLILKVKSKRYTYARISRILMHLLMDVKAETFHETKKLGLYARPLAFNEQGAAVLRKIKKSGFVPVYTNLKRNVPENAPERKLLNYDIKASDIYNILMDKRIHENSDFLARPGSVGYN